MENPRFDKGRFTAWVLLIGAIIAEVIGTSFLKMEFSKIFIYANMTLFIAVSYYLMGLAIKRIQVGIAYAVWELLGTIFVVLISLFVFGEKLTWSEILGIILAILGIILINMGEYKG